MATKIESEPQAIRREIGEGAEFTHRSPADDASVRLTFPRALQQIQVAVRDLQEALRSERPR